MNNIVSVAICTYNRADSLLRTLNSLCKTQTADMPGWELLLIDNNSTDYTKQVVETYADCLPMRYVFEPKQGLANARNRAIDEYDGELLVFTDDDIVVDTTWLATYREAVMRYPSAAYFGGPIEPCFPAGRPSWLVDKKMSLISGLIGYYYIDKKSRRYCGDDMHPFGANFALRRHVFDKVGLFDPQLGVKGNVPSRAEESDYFSRIRSMDFVGVYLVDALCHHCVQASHLGVRHLFRYGVQKGMAEVYMHAGESHNTIRLSHVAWQLLRGIGQYFKGRPDRFRQSVISAGIYQGIRNSSKHYKSSQIY